MGSGAQITHLLMEPMSNEQDVITGYVLGLVSVAMMRRAVTFHR